LLEGREICKRFGGLEALRNVSFHVNKGEILGLIGPNGAGKTTLFNVITGFIKPNSGSVRFKGIDITGLKPYKISRLGIGRTFQLSKPITDMTVLDNVATACIFGGRKHVDVKEARKMALEKLEFVGLANKSHLFPLQLNIVERKLLEIARALSLDPELLLLDEPLSGLNPSEIDLATGMMRKIRDELNITIFWIEHVMRAIMKTVDRIIVLHHGAKIAEGSSREISRNPLVIKAYLGEDYA
jgi:branched-chain amino acid transport system ATP-binding protein